MIVTNISNTSKYKTELDNKNNSDKCNDIKKIQFIVKKLLNAV